MKIWCYETFEEKERAFFHSSCGSFQDFGRANICVCAMRMCSMHSSIVGNTSQFVSLYFTTWRTIYYIVALFLWESWWIWVRNWWLWENTYLAILYVQKTAISVAFFACCSHTECARPGRPSEKWQNDGHIPKEICCPTFKMNFLQRKPLGIQLNLNIFTLKGHITGKN